MTRRTYFDHAATTPLDPRVLEAMLPCLSEHWGNPSSVYAEAREAKHQLEQARRSVAEVLRAHPAEIVFTSGGTEADNLALLGLAESGRGRGMHVITSATEHHAVLHAAQLLEQRGFRVTYLPVDGEGFADLSALQESLTDDTILVSVMLANNETGTIQPVAEIARLAKSVNPRVLVHTDAVQAPGMLPMDATAVGVDALSLSGHKFYGPKGTGALYLRGGTALQAQIVGGSQEKEHRAGTENLAGCVGLAAALQIAEAEREARVNHVRALRHRLMEEIPRRINGTIITGPQDPARRLANNASFCFEGIDAETLLLQLDLAGFATSSGSACTSGSLEPSHVLTAMGVPPDLARGSLRLTLGHSNSLAEVDGLLEVLPSCVERLRSLRVQTEARVTSSA